MTPLPRRSIASLWSAHRPLTAVGLGSLLALIGCAVGLAADPRLVTGAPVWLKPAKFAASIAIYTLTFAWLLRFVAPAWARRSRRAGSVIAGALALELAIIAFQAARGRPSHFNIATPLDGALFGAMGVTIAVLWLASLTVAVSLFRTRAPDRVMGEALRWGLAINLVGGAFGGLMTRPTLPQLAAIRAGERPTVVGAHTVGAPDGGPGVRGVGWSTERGDLRVAHFIGLHALQALPLFAWWLGRRRRPVEPAAGVKLVRVAAAAWLALAVVLAVEALRGVSVVAPDVPTAVALGAILVVAGLAAAGVMRRPTLTLEARAR